MRLFLPLFYGSKHTHNPNQLRNFQFPIPIHPSIPPGCSGNGILAHVRSPVPTGLVLLVGWLLGSSLKPMTTPTSSSLIEQLKLWRTVPCGRT